MYALSELLETDKRFQNSINLLLDLKNYSKMEQYIPTRSSVAILKEYLQDFLQEEKTTGTGKASVLIGPYGKGKSHLILVLISLLSKVDQDPLAKEKISSLIKKIKSVDSETTEMIQKLQKRNRPFLTVLITATNLTLNQALIRALHEALKRENLEQIAPDSYFSEALKMVNTWENSFPEVYQQFLAYLESQKISPSSFTEKMQAFDLDMLERFKTVYPKLTAGNTFNPILQVEALKLYQEVNHKLCEEYGFGGIYIVFDEFSKYVEGHGEQNFAEDMKILQDICELANGSRKEEQVHLTLIAHKSIKEYGNHLSASVRKEFEGVEGRIKERLFVVSAGNNYELIMSAIKKKDPLFSQELTKGQEAEKIENLIMESYKLPCFCSLFQEKEFRRVIGAGCFPLTPLAAYIVLAISEKVAQNERTIFTFLSYEEYGSLAYRIKEHQSGKSYYIGADTVYDYFRNLFKENVVSALIHNEWLKADYSIGKAQTEEEKSVIKAIALIHMINNVEELPANDAVLLLATGMSKQNYMEAKQGLLDKNLIIYRNKTNMYAFKNNVGVDLDKEIRNLMASEGQKLQIDELLPEVSELEYVLPKAHNQQFAMTRFFRYEFITASKFLKLNKAEYLFEEKFSDGNLVAIVWNEENKIDDLLDEIAAKAAELGEERLVVLLPDEPFEQQENLKKILAIRKLLQNEEFLANNLVIEQELRLYEEDILFEINARLEDYYAPEAGKCTVLQLDEKKRFHRSADFNRFLSDICGKYYQFAPRVNHELINIQNVTGQYLKARNLVETALLNEEDCSKFYKGTSPESIVFRAALLRTGLVDKQYPQDGGSGKILMEINTFFQSCVGNKQSFRQLYQKLQGKDYGVRKGILPLFLASQLVRLSDVPVIYLGNIEVEVNASILDNVNEKPEEYYLYLEEASAAKENYLKTLEENFLEENQLQGVINRRKRLNIITSGIQKWYRSLPQYTLNFTVNANKYPEDIFQAILGFRAIFRKMEINPREVLFEKMPLLFGENIDYEATSNGVLQIKQILSQFLELEMQKAVNNAKTAFSISKTNSLGSGLRDWYDKQSDASKTYINSTRVSSLMNWLANLKTNYDVEIAAKLSKIVLDVYVEDWKDGSLDEYLRILKETRMEVERLTDHEENASGKYTLSFTGSDGTPVNRTYDVSEDDSTSYFLKNAIESAMEDFGDTLETNQKVAVLVQTIEQLLKNK